MLKVCSFWCVNWTRSKFFPKLSSSLQIKLSIDAQKSLCLNISLHFLYLYKRTRKKLIFINIYFNPIYRVNRLYASIPSLFICLFFQIFLLIIETEVLSVTRIASHFKLNINPSFLPLWMRLKLVAKKFSIILLKY